MNGIHKIFGIEEIDSKTKATQIFNKYFETRHCWVNTGEARIKGKRIIKKIAD